MDGGNGSRISDDARDKALVDIEDLLQRVMVPFFLFGETARSLKEDRILKGEVIEIGVREVDLTQSALNTIKTFDFNGTFKETLSGFEYESHGIPIKVTLVKRRYKFLDHPDYIFYRAGEYLIPNPFDGYWRARRLVQ